MIIEQHTTRHTEPETSLARRVLWIEGPRSVAWDRLWRRILTDISLPAGDQSGCDAAGDCDDGTAPESFRQP